MPVLNIIYLYVYITPIGVMFLYTMSMKRGPHQMSILTLVARPSPEQLFKWCLPWQTVFVNSLHMQCPLQTTLHNLSIRHFYMHSSLLRPTIFSPAVRLTHLFSHTWSLCCCFSDCTIVSRIQDGCKTSNDVLSPDTSSEESRREVGCGGNEDVKMDKWSHQAGQN